MGLDLLWQASWRALGAEGAPSADDLRKRYEEPRRAYHNWSHICDCLALAERWGLSGDAVLVLALFYHDAVYRPGAADNERQSAALAASALSAGGIAAAHGEQVAGLILATRHDREAHNALEAAICDLDLAILGSTPLVYEAYAGNIRREFAEVPEAAYRAGRANFLRTMLARPRIFQTPRGLAELEAPARRNLAAELDGLTAPALWAGGGAGVGGSLAG